MDDWVDEVQAQWRRSRPEVDPEPAGVFLRVLRVARLVERLTGEALEEFGVDRAGFEVLSVLARTDTPVSPTRIATELQLTGAGTTKRLRQVEAAGLVRRRPNAQDGRSVDIELTEQGQAVIAPAIDSIHTLEASWLDDLSAPDRDALVSGLRTVLGALTRAAESS
ncbi:MarR family transcriptional regulator [Pseudonocardia sp. RS11V-5]|uniref:MarR family winged helix-turn-helix transcriptional regulator n=1 Tax=Pseudonocardia terrae TaxID=2905831 RepID=UPI001E463E19|nr:MarR family transcriptional regulator [Pseudonocardia terrae]MCE3555800.1 MarR family transcriptional regulator [Pseudonocardia terrae]